MNKGISKSAPTETSEASRNPTDHQWNAPPPPPSTNDIVRNDNNAHGNVLTDSWKRSWKEHARSENQWQNAQSVFSATLGTENGIHKPQ